MRGLREGVDGRTDIHKRQRICNSPRDVPDERRSREILCLPLQPKLSEVPSSYAFRSKSNHSIGSFRGSRVKTILSRWDESVSVPGLHYDGTQTFLCRNCIAMGRKRYCNETTSRWYANVTVRRLHHDGTQTLL